MVREIPPFRDKQRPAPRKDMISTSRPLLAELEPRRSHKLNRQRGFGVWARMDPENLGN